VLTGRHHDSTPHTKRLQTDDRSNVLVYMTGHGGNEFLKFQDTEELTSRELADAFAQMHEKRRYNEILFMVDTCQAQTLYKRLYSPRILAVGSSDKGENSYSHHSDPETGVSVIDRFTYYTLEFCERVRIDSNATLADLFSYYSFSKLYSTANYTAFGMTRDVRDIRVTEFFGSVIDVELTYLPDIAS